MCLPVCFCSSSKFDDTTANRERETMSEKRGWQRDFTADDLLISLCLLMFCENDDERCRFDASIELRTMICCWWCRLCVRTWLFLSSALTSSGRCGESEYQLAPISYKNAVSHTKTRSAGVHAGRPRFCMSARLQCARETKLRRNNAGRMIVRAVIPPNSNFFEAKHFKKTAVQQ